MEACRHSNLSVFQRKEARLDHGLICDRMECLKKQKRKRWKSWKKMIGDSESKRIACEEMSLSSCMTSDK